MPNKLMHAIFDRLDELTNTVKETVVHEDFTDVYELLEFKLKWSTINKQPALEIEALLSSIFPIFDLSSDRKLKDGEKEYWHSKTTLTRVLAPADKE